MNERRSNAIPIPANAASVTPLESVNTGPRRAKCGASYGLTPQRPVFTMFIVQQRILQEIARIGERPARSNQLRATDRHQVVIQQAVSLQFRPAADTMTHGKIDPSLSKSTRRLVVPIWISICG